MIDLYSLIWVPSHIHFRNLVWNILLTFTKRKSDYYLGLKDMKSYHCCRIYNSTIKQLHPWKPRKIFTTDWYLVILLINNFTYEPIGFSQTLARCLALYLGDPRKFSMGFSVNFQASAGKKLWENKDGNSYGTCKFDAKHSTITFWYLGKYLN